MLLSVLLLLLVCGSQAINYYGTVMTYYPKEVATNGSLLVNVRYKLSFVACADNDTWSCSGNCGNETAGVDLNIVDESIGEWCQREGIMTRLVSGTAPFELVLAGESWITGIINSIASWRAVTDVELSFRSDSSQINTSPVTTILPALRVQSNCPRNISLLAFDPDGDEVKCRNGITSDSECNPCTPPSVLNLSSSCILSFSPTNSSNEGPYAVQLVMEDFPRQNINLFQPDGSLVQKTTNEAISKIPVQFVLKVDPAVPSCVEGIYLPRFLSPTPAHGAQILTTVNQIVEINIRAEATQSTISGLLFSGPHNVVKSSQGSGNFTLTWTPSLFENGESHPICFVVQSSLASSVYQSDLRCIIVKIGNHSAPSLLAQTVAPTTAAPTATITPATTTVVSGTVTPVTPPVTSQSPTTTATMTASLATTAPPMTTPHFTTTTTTMVPTSTTVIPIILPPTSTQSPTTTAAAPTTTTHFPTTMPATTTTTPSPTTVIFQTTATMFPTTTTASPTTTIPATTTTTPMTTTTTPATTTTTPMTTTTTPATTTTTPATTTTTPATTTTTPATTTTTPATTTTTPATTTTTAATTTTTPATTTTTAPTTTTTTTTTTVSTTPPPASTSDPGPYYVIALNAKISTTLSLENDYNQIVQLIKNELIYRGLPSNIIITIQRNGELEITTASP